jgi:hypothetical protein
MVDYCIDELKHKAAVFKQTGFVHVYNGDVLKSDCAIPAELQAALRAAVVPLENEATDKQDYLPGSNNQVFNIVDPSLFPLIYGMSRILTDSTIGLDDCLSRSGQGEITSSERGAKLGWYSKRFQWLPCNVDISGSSPRYDCPRK